MQIEEEIFQKTQVDWSKLKQFGFQKSKAGYMFSTFFMNDEFRVDVLIDIQGKVSAHVFEVATGDEYTSFRVERHQGSFVNAVREAYKAILLDIKNNCFSSELFLSEQANRIAKYIIEKYHVSPEFLWEKFPGYDVFRNSLNQKWFAIIMDVDRSKFTVGSGEVTILDVKVEEERMTTLLQQDGFYPGYHMNKRSWITVVLDDSVSDETIQQIIDDSYQLISAKEAWIIPANPTVYDIIGHFERTDMIEWKKPKDVQVGDIVYIYMCKPYAAILYKCDVVKTNAGKEQETPTMCLRIAKRYKEDTYPLTKLQSYGLKSVRSPRRISKKVGSLLENDMN